MLQRPQPNPLTIPSSPVSADPVNHARGYRAFWLGRSVTSFSRPTFIQHSGRQAGRAFEDVDRTPSGGPTSRRVLVLQRPADKSPTIPSSRVFGPANARREGQRAFYVGWRSRLHDRLFASNIPSKNRAGMSRQATEPDVTRIGRNSRSAHCASRVGRQKSDS